MLPKSHLKIPSFTPFTLSERVKWVNHNYNQTHRLILLSTVTFFGVMLWHWRFSLILLVLPIYPYEFCGTHVLMLAEQFLCGYNEPKLLQTRFLGQSLRGRMQNISFRCSGVSWFQSYSAVSTFTLRFFSTSFLLAISLRYFSLAAH